MVPLIVGSTFSGVLSLQVSLDAKLARGIARRTLLCYFISMQVLPRGSSLVALRHWRSCRNH